MEPEKGKEENIPAKKSTHTYADDLSKALDTTDARVVQELLTEGREREAIEKGEEIRAHQRGWYKAGAIILIICTLLAFGYSVYYYTHLTVVTEKAVSVGVFPSTSVIVAVDTDIRNAIKLLSEDTTLEESRPYLVSLVSDQSTLALLTPAELFSFFEAKASEPLITSFNLVRLGIMSTQEGHIPFVIGVTKDAEISAKELLIAEPTLLQTLYRPLGIDMSGHETEIGKSFSGEYLYNIPIRALRYDSDEEKGKLLFFYARVSDDIVVFTTSPAVLKAIYDSLIRQGR
ncbi:MAG: hypothetical protein AAB681_01715 [Patescibacteria group bacterium]